MPQPMPLRCGPRRQAAADSFSDKPPPAEALPGLRYGLGLGDLRSDVIQFKDFVPEVLEPARFLRPLSAEAFEVAAQRASDWASQPGVNVINVETVVLANMHHKNEEGSGDTSLPVTADMGTTWHQFVRVW